MKVSYSALQHLKQKISRLEESLSQLRGLNGRMEQVYRTTDSSVQRIANGGNWLGKKKDSFSENYGQTNGFNRYILQKSGSYIQFLTDSLHYLYQKKNELQQLLEEKEERERQARRNQ